MGMNPPIPRIFIVNGVKDLIKKKKKIIINKTFLLIILLIIHNQYNITAYMYFKVKL